MNVPIPWAPLYSSQTSGESSLESVRWRGDWREFWVQWHEDRVYFQLVEGEPTVWSSLETCAQNQAITCFEGAVCERRYGACFLVDTKVRYGWSKEFYSLQFIYAPDGAGLLREWSSRDWITFAPYQTRIWALFPDLHLPNREADESRECCQYAANSVRDLIMFRRVGDEEIDALAWRTNITQAEFECVMRWIWRAGLFHFEENRYRSVSLVSCSLGTRGNGWARPNVPLLQSVLHLPDPQGENAQKFQQWLRSYFVGEGLGWQATEWGQRRFRRLRAREPHLRAFFEARSIYWHVYFDSDSTFHQQLEARLQLRAWLLQRATPDETERFLRAD